MTRETVSKQANKIIIQKRQEFLSDQAKLESDVMKIYTRMDKSISSAVLRSEVSLTALFYELDQFSRRLRKESWNISDRLKRVKDNALWIGLQSGYLVEKYIREMRGSERLSEAITADFYDDEMMTIMMNQLFDEAAKSLQLTVNGIELSSRIWELNETSLQQMRNFFSSSMVAGTSRSEIYSFVKGFLLLPDVDMRKKVWKEYFEAHPPGRGVYKSAWKNVLRVLRTETNRSYRTGIAKYAQGRDWIKGLKWNRVTGSEPCELCDEAASADLYGLGPGVYPAESAPDIKHPHDICFYTYVIDFGKVTEGAA